MPNVVDNAGANGDGPMILQTFIQDSDLPRHGEFVQPYQKAFKVDRIPVPSPAAQADDSTHLLVSAIRRAGVTDGPEVREALENPRETVQGAIATYDKPFAKARHEATDASIPVFGVLRGGRVVLADPRDKLRRAPRKQGDPLDDDARPGVHLAGIEVRTGRGRIRRSRRPSAASA